MFTPITVPSRSSPETFATEAELAIAGLAQFILDYNQLGSILNTAITSTSTTSLVIGTGSKSLTVQTGLNLVPGYPVRLAYTTSPTDNMDGTVTTYNISTGALVVEVASVNGSGTYANWQVMVLPSATGNFADKSTANTFTDVQTFSGGVAANPLIKKQSDPTLGGALLLEKSSGSSLAGNLKFELSGNSIRIYENGGSSRGVTLDITTLAASIADKILTTASLKNATNDSTFSSASSTDSATPEWVIGFTRSNNNRLLGTLTTTSGTVQTLSSLDLSGYKFVKLVFDNVANSAGDAFNINGPVGFVPATGSAGRSIWGILDIDLFTGVFTANVNIGSSTTGIVSGQLSSVQPAGKCSVTNASTSINISCNSGNFTSGSIRIYGVI